jgi:hypothetical protein
MIGGQHHGLETFGLSIERNALPGWKALSVSQLSEMCSAAASVRTTHPRLNELKLAQALICTVHAIDSIGKLYAVDEQLAPAY